MRRLPTIAAALLSTAALLTACSSLGVGEREPAPRLACPGVLAVADAMQMTRYIGEGRDLTDVDFEARIADVDYECEYVRGNREILADMTVRLNATRGPANRDGRAQFSYFVAVTTNEAEPRVLTREVLPVDITFEGNRTTVGIADELTPRIPLAEGASGRDFRLYVGLMLSPDELEFNRRR